MKPTWVYDMRPFSLIPIPRDAQHHVSIHWRGIEVFSSVSAIEKHLEAQEYGSMWRGWCNPVKAYSKRALCDCWTPYP